MKFVVLSLLLLISSDPREIAKVNSLKKEAEKAFISANYIQAANTYKLLDSLGVKDEALKLNLAHSLYKVNDTASAKLAYQSATASTDKKLKSIAYQQLGVMKKNENKLEEALQDLKAALKADPTNEGARYDYEVIKKLLEEQKKQEQENKDQNKDQKEENEEKKDQEQNKDQDKEGDKKEDQKENSEEKDSKEEKGEKKDGENEDGEEKEGEQEPTPEEQMKEKLKEMNISEEKAQMILEALRNNEIQYLQQQKRKATKRPASGKPDW